MKRCCVVETELLLYTPILHSKLKMMIITTNHEIILNFHQDRTSVEPSTIPFEIISQNPPRVSKSSNTGMLPEKVQNPSSDLKELFSEVSSLEQTQIKNELLRLQSKKR